MHDVLLGPSTLLLAYMQQGKTETCNTLISMINDAIPVKHLNLKTRYYDHVFKLHESDLVDKIQKADMINLLVDDAISGAHSQKANSKLHIDHFKIRHYFQEELGWSEGTINLFFGAQQYKKLDNTIRRCPIKIFKGMDTSDPGEADLLSHFLDQKKIGLLQRWFDSVTFDKNISTLKQTLVLAGGHRASRLTFPKIKPVEWTAIEVPNGHKETKGESDAAILRERLVVEVYGPKYIGGEMDKKDIAKALGLSVSSVEKQLGKFNFHRYQTRKAPLTVVS